MSFSLKISPESQLFNNLLICRPYSLFVYSQTCIKDLTFTQLYILCHTGTGSNLSTTNRIPKEYVQRIISTLKVMHISGAVLYCYLSIKMTTSIVIFSIHLGQGPLYFEIQLNLLVHTMLDSNSCSISC